MFYKCKLKFWEWLLHKVPFWLAAPVNHPRKVKVFLESDNGEYVMDQWVWTLDTEKYPELMKSKSLLVAIDVTEDNGNTCRFYAHLTK